uniref:Uncharacterized protein n=1 Tax=Lotus japonicus TaxID=34305 RepID=I3S019_LOTJA|nr:unknown [Lotus japonicus]AFK44562.1 unknown [Lotus japonicus]
MMTERNFFFSWLAKQTMSTLSPVTDTRSLSSPSSDTAVTPLTSAAIFMALFLHLSQSICNCITTFCFMFETRGNFMLLQSE